MKSFVFRHGPGYIDGLRVIANIGDKGSAQKIPEVLPPGKAYHWAGATSIVVSGSVLVTLTNGVQVTLRRGDVLPSVARVAGEMLEEALEDNTLLYCFQHRDAVPGWSRGFLLDSSTPLRLSARARASRCILVAGRAQCNGMVDMSAESAPHILRVSPNKDLSIVGDGVLLYMFEPELAAEIDPAEDSDPLVDDYMKGLTVLSPRLA